MKSSISNDSITPATYYHTDTEQHQRNELLYNGFLQSNLAVTPLYKYACDS